MECVGKHRQDFAQLDHFQHIHPSPLLVTDSTCFCTAHAVLDSKSDARIELMTRLCYTASLC